jgi:hypothetical protein
MQLHVIPLPHSNDVVALMYGPIVLAARLGSEGIAPGADIIVNERKSGEMLNVKMELPQLSFQANEVNAKIQRSAPEKLAFNVKAQQPSGDIELIPFYRIAHERYSLYWQLV